VVLFPVTLSDLIA